MNILMIIPGSYLLILHKKYVYKCLSLYKRVKSFRFYDGSDLDLFIVETVGA